MNKNLALKIIIILFVIGIVTSLTMYFSGFKFEDFLEEHNFGMGVKISFLLLFFTFRNYFFIPSTIVILLAGFILQDFWPTLIVSEIGVGIGLLQTYFVGKTFEGHFENTNKFRVIKSYMKKIKENGFKVIFFGSLIPVLPVDLIYYAAALSKYDIRKFFLAGIMGETPLIILYCYMGAEAEKYFAYIVGIFTILGTLYVFYILYKHKD
ncbi:TVP38/TMEM64 family protein [Candidatus Gracilibacteria bacterium]|nr:MAG: TVP38/TMEM64 family protein [Candidatus Gracilibacteria bacterium]